MGGDIYPNVDVPVIQEKNSEKFSKRDLSLTLKMTEVGIQDGTSGVSSEKNFSLKKAAFTLTEVLITLGIIGVVAALTISNVIQDYQKKQTVVQLRKVYNDINNAVKLSEVDNGPMSQWDYVQRTCYVYECIAPFLEKYYLPYFKDAQFVGLF